MTLFQRLWHDERGFIGTTAAIAIAVGMGAQTAASVYNAKKASKQNENVLSAQERDAIRASDQAKDDAAIQREALASEERYRQAQLDRDRERWGEYVKINQPHWDLGNRVLGNLADLAGYRGAGTGEMRGGVLTTPTAGPPQMSNPLAGVLPDGPTAGSGGPMAAPGLLPPGVMGPSAASALPSGGAGMDPALNWPVDPRTGLRMPARSGSPAAPRRFAQMGLPNAGGGLDLSMLQNLAQIMSYGGGSPGPSSGLSVG
jgi:hypothetical protein